MTTALAGWPRQQEKAQAAGHWGVTPATVDTRHQQKYPSFVVAMDNKWSK